MSWLSIPEIVPVGLSYRTGTVVTILQEHMDGIVDAPLSDKELRTFLNMALAHYVRNTDDERYQETWDFDVAKVTGTQYYEHDLQSLYTQTTAVNYAHRYPLTHKNLSAEQFIPGNAIAKILSILPKWTMDESPTNKYHGSARELNLENFDGLVNGTNTSYRHTVAWCRVGRKLLLYYGQQTNVAASSPQVEVPATWQMRLRRMPLLDDLESYLADGTNTALDRIFDCPDDAIATVVSHAASLILASKNPQPEAGAQRADSRVQGALQRGLTESQTEVASQEAQRLGFPSR